MAQTHLGIEATLLKEAGFYFLLDAVYGSFHSLEHRRSKRLCPRIVFPATANSEICRVMIVFTKYFFLGPVRKICANAPLSTGRYSQVVARIFSENIIHHPERPPIGNKLIAFVTDHPIAIDARIVMALYDRICSSTQTFKRIALCYVVLAVLNAIKYKIITH